MELYALQSLALQETNTTDIVSGMNYWLMKSEPAVYSYRDLANTSKNGDIWDGVRNYQARNFMKEMKTGDLVLFYHSNTNPPGVAGLAEVIGEAEPDPTQFDPSSKYFDPKSSREKPRWIVVRVRALREFPRTVSLHELRTVPELQELKLLQKGNRLSVMPVSETHADIIMKTASTSAVEQPSPGQDRE